jgi:hypothetical protein
LCLESTPSGKSALLIHFARHMEDIALAALPREVESEDESDRGLSNTSPESSIKEDNVVQTMHPGVRHTLDEL